jgi:hypothetical protein
MAEKTVHSKGPWTWTDFGVLSNADGEALLDYEDWNVSPEDAVLIAAAPELLAWVSRVVEKYGSALEDSDRAEGERLIAKATDPRHRE